LLINCNILPSVTDSAAPQCVILVGLPAAGKSYFYSQRFSTTHHHLSKDFAPPKITAERWQRQELESALGRGESIVVDNTHPTAKDRAAVIALARTHGARVVGYFFDVSTRQAVARNADRTGKAKVPNVAIFRTAKRMERPRLEEGFDELYVVTLTPEREFAVAPVQNERRD
jgi:predicted kinase